MYAEANSGRWNVAMALIRPLQERSEYALAAAVDPEFFATYRKRMGQQIETGLQRSLKAAYRGGARNRQPLGGVEGHRRPPQDQ